MIFHTANKPSYPRQSNMKGRDDLRMKNEIYIRRRHKLLLNAGSNETADYLAVEKLANKMKSLGYSMSQNLIEIILTKTTTEIEAIEDELTGLLRETPAACPIQLELGSEDDFIEIFTEFLSGYEAIDKQWETDLIWFVQHYYYFEHYLPDNIPKHEKRAILGKAILQSDCVGGMEILKRYITSVSDVLLLAIALSDGDITMQKLTRFRSFPRRHRRCLLNLLMRCDHLYNGLCHNRSQWLRLEGKLHPHEFGKKYEALCTAFDQLRMNCQPAPVLA